MRKNSTKRLGIIGASSVGLALAAVVASAAPAFAGEWLFGIKSCDPGTPYIHTESYGSGQVTHAHERPNDYYSTKTWNNYTYAQNRVYNSLNGYVLSASVAGASTTWASIYCDV
ncbi:hypothetical protein [Agromyces larvae]|uniref:Lactococcin 972 family bacteriocin n=1 Tax=Agromyces larvae TaxID=2929802 RepID=A0ABY4BVD4_9MICO|nr:hypothetical protein [Agromyces larvae]UOE43178.1 hypothetical protein MTO99_13405 [Agromyces larvae]